MTHFVGLAIVLFAVAEVVQATRAEVIEIDPVEVEARIRQMERASGVLLTEDERRLAELAHIDEMILAREARARGLDDDTRIRSILSQKMLHLMSMGLTQPSDTELRAFFEENEVRYAAPASVTVDQLLALRGTGDAIPVTHAGPGQRSELTPPRPGDGAEMLGRTDAYEHTVLRAVTLNELSMAFGVETAGSIFHADDQVWVGPHRTERGSLWFRTVERLDAGPAPSFESVIGQVRFDWMTEHEEPFLQEQVAELRQRYRIRLVDGDNQRR